MGGSSSGTTPSDFQSRSTTKKGNVGQAAVERLLARDGWIAYWPEIEGGAHPIDFMAAKKDMRHILIGDVKAKPAYTHYPDTGIDERHFDTYLRLSRKYRLPMLLCFVDEVAEIVYGNYLTVLKRARSVYWRGARLTYPRKQPGRTGPTINFPLDYMKAFGDLLDDEVKALRQSSTRNPSYGPNTEAYARLGCALAEGSIHPAQTSFTDEARYA